MSTRGRGGLHPAQYYAPNAGVNLNVTEMVNQLTAVNAANRHDQKVDIEKFLKFRPPFFKGTANPFLAEQWWDEIELIFK